MRFDNDTLKNRYQTCRSYLEKRCDALPGQIERKFKNVSCYHEASTCFGMSNYINVEIQDENGDYVDSFDVRISDHSPTGSGESCDKYIYIDGKEWADIKKEVLEYIASRLENER